MSSSIKTLENQKKINFSSGTAETIRFLLQRKHDRQADNQELELLDVMLQAFKRTEVDHD